MLLPRRLEMAGSRILVVYYFQSGTTRKIAEALSEALTCDLEEIVEDTSRSDLYAVERMDGPKRTVALSLAFSTFER